MKKLIILILSGITIFPVFSQETYTLEQCRELASENVRLTGDKAGTVMLTDLLDAQSALQQTRDQHTDAVINYRLKLSEYRQATGQKE
jgi:outer membrane protein TolC